MKKIIFIGVLLAAGGLAYLYRGPLFNVKIDDIDNEDNTPVVHMDMIRVDSPLPNATVSSPLKITGEARGGWYFEASFPVWILDGDGNQLGIAPAQAKGDWMTSEFVPFELNLDFDLPVTEKGTLVVHNDNPSGLPENDKEVRIPITFSKFATSTTKIKLYYYDQSKDKDASGNILCSEKGLVAVDRKIPKSLLPLHDAIDLLIEGRLTAEERSKGITTEFPLAGLNFTGASIASGKATLNFVDHDNATSGGSCRINILRAQIEKTAKQFPTVTSIIISPNSVFQP